MTFHLQIDPILRNALLEDLGLGDVTVDALPVLNRMGDATIGARKACVVSGIEVARRIFSLVDESIVFKAQVQDGDSVEAGTVLARVCGPKNSLLKAERTALNFLQHLSGIATETHRFVQAVAGTAARITDTRKTTPGLRILEKQAVQHGGGFPHRFNLGCAAMLKDNHLEAVGSISESVRQLRDRVSHTVKIEVEVENLYQVQEAVMAKADIIMLDNMSPAQIREALEIIGELAITEASGGINLQTVREYAETGVRYISTSQITLGAPAVDIGLDFHASSHPVHENHDLNILKS